MRVNTLFKYWTSRLFAPGAALRATYDAFRDLLVHDRRSHELMAELEALYYQGKREDFCRIRARYDALSASVSGMVESLERMAPGSFPTLPEYFRKFDFYGRFLLAPPALRLGPPFILPLTDPAVRTDLVGSKGANLAELANTLHLPVPPGFIITVKSFHSLLEHNELRGTINTLLARIDLALPDTLAQISRELITLVTSAKLPPDIHQAILAAQATLCPEQHDNIRMAVRSSAVGEDGECSFAGQYVTLLEVEKEQLPAAYLTVIAGKYSPEALAYRIHCGLSDEETPMAVLVLTMVDAVASGVVYTMDPAGRNTTNLLIHAVQGQGEALVSGKTIPQVMAVDREETTHHGSVPQDAGLPPRPRVLTDEQATTLAAHAMKIEAHFKTPQDIEWSMTGNGTIFFLQSRPLQSQTADIENESAAATEIQDQPLLRGGTVAALGQACGPAYCVDAGHPLQQVPRGAILVVRETLPSHVQILDRVSGVLAELGSAAGHFSTVCREFGIPLLCGLGAALQAIPHGQLITMQAAGRVVYRGDLLPHLTTAPLHESQKHLPFYRRLRKLLAIITPLHLVDSRARDFAPESCRSLHDIIRFTHEQAVNIMFSLGDRLGNRSANRKKLLSALPFDIFVVDVGGGLASSAAGEETVTVDRIRSAPFLALWTGLMHASVHWQERAHFDWKHFGEITLADGIASIEAPEFVSYAVLGADYLHLIMRFGYHFTLIDGICGPDSSSNYCQFRFAGGGAAFSGRLLRLDFISTLLQEKGFQIETRGDLLNARISGLPAVEMKTRLLTLGRLLGATRLMDMAIRDQQEVQCLVQDFLTETGE